MPLTAVWILVALAAILVAAAVPALLQLRRTLQVAEQTLQSTGRRVEEALDHLGTTLERIDRASAELEGGVRRVSSLLEALGSVGDTLGKVRSSIGTMASLGASLGSVLIGAVRAAFEGRGESPSSSEPEHDAPSEREELSR